MRVCLSETYMCGAEEMMLTAISELPGQRVAWCWCCSTSRQRSVKCVGASRSLTTSMCEVAYVDAGIK